MIHTQETVSNTVAYVEAVGKWLNSLLSSWGISEQYASMTRFVILFALLIVGVAVILYLVNKIVSFFFKKGAKITNLKLLNYMMENKLPYYISLLAPYTLIKATIPILLMDYPSGIVFLDKLIDIFLVLIIIWMVLALVKSFINVLQENPAFANKPMHGYVQILSIILYIVGLIIIFSIITGKSATAILATLGAASAILMLMFQDSIKGFVGSIQMSTNHMVELGDWITMNKYGADGEVKEVSLNTVKVQNFDKTITTIPTYALISDSFQNWRGMQESGGRRTKKSIYIKQSSIRFMRSEELAKFREIDYLNDVIKEREELNKSMDKSLIDGALPVTNNDLYMAYAMHYLKEHPGVNQDLTLLVRQMMPSEKGIPVELYFFTATTVWAQYEAISTEILNHLIGMVPMFDLKVFELLASE